MMARRAATSVVRQAGPALIGVTLLCAALAPFLAPQRPDDRFPHLLNAPPTILRVVDESGHVRAPFIYPWRLVNQLEQTYEPDRTAPVTLVWFKGGRLVQSAAPAQIPLLLLGADGFGRDVFARLLFAARVSLSLSIVAALGAVCLGALAGGIAGYAGGFIDDGVMRASELVLVLPAMYVVLALRAAMPLVLSPGSVFLLLGGIFMVIGAPSIARGVRGIVRSERHADYAVAAVSLGAGHRRLLLSHLLPATRGFIVVQVTLLVPAFIVGEATLSFVGLGFAEPVASWGTMLQDATSLRALVDFPWLLSPAAAMFAVVMGLNLMLQDERRFSPSN
jgi:peptide/nickel transport system permease protein